MAKGNAYYAVAVGRKPGIYKSWNETESMVKKFSGAVYKKFFSSKDALKYIIDNGTEEKLYIDSLSKEEREEIAELLDIYYSGNTKTPETLETSSNMEQPKEKLEWGCEISGETNGIIPPTKNSNEISQKEMNSDQIIVYTDGSYQSSSPIAGWGFVILPNKRYGIGKLIKGYGSCKDINNSRKYRNIYGELSAVVWAINLLKGHLKDKPFVVNIHHDLEGVEKWMTGWKTNNELTQTYKSYMNEMKSQGIRMNFTKVDAHTGDTYNELADHLAKLGTECEINTRHVEIDDYEVK